MDESFWPMRKPTMGKKMTLPLTKTVAQLSFSSPSTEQTIRFLSFHFIGNVSIDV